MSLIRDVSDTAIWVAQYRARESARPDAIFRDPLAKVLTGERGEQIARSFGAASRYTEWSVVARTVLIDEFITEAVKDGVDAVLNLGAGLDTRPYRMELPVSLQWVEADFPHMVAYKQQMLQAHKPQCRLQWTGLDLSDPTARRRLLARVAPGAKKILVLTEGVIPYLTEDQVAELAKDLRVRTQFAFWLAEYFSPQVYRYLRATARSRQMANAPFRFFPADWQAFFSDHGWARKEIHYSSEVAQRFNRTPPMPWFAKLLLPFASKETLERMRLMSGYALMTPCS
ncbi:MAG: SAM-dependent methyltransferase [Steroidobacteraceae bacterium]